MPRAAVAFNLLKVWLLVAVLATVFGGIGWLIGGPRSAVFFAF